MKIDVTTRENLFDLENKLARIGKLSGHYNIEMRLARNLRSDFFCESRLAALLATAGQRHNLTVSDWHREWSDEEIEAHYRTSLVGIAAVLHSDRLTNDRGVDLPDDRNSLVERIGIAGGLLEPRHGGQRGKSITFCAFDPNWSEPAAFAGTINQPEAFKAVLRKYRRKYLEIGQGLVHTDFTRQADDRLCDFIFELYQNAHEHGRSKGEPRAANGMRYLRLRKYIDRKENFIAQAQGFHELVEYLEAVTPDGASFKFYEITVSDNGPGIVNHFLNARPDFSPRPNSNEDLVGLVNDLLTKPLTSKRDFPGAGYGLPRAL
ncbi:MAG TPA: hypothetical protein VN904_04255, partial [Chthoniobacterales bacterium]|nr:hypothetical protein [Chthoniobacterales bacterium]